MSDSMSVHQMKHGDYCGFTKPVKKKTKLISKPEIDFLNKLL